CASGAVQPMILTPASIRTNVLVTRCAHSTVPRDRCRNSRLRPPELMTHGLQLKELDSQPIVVARARLSPYHKDGRQVGQSQGRTIHRDRLRWDLLFRIAMSLTFLGGDVVLAGFLVDRGGLVDGRFVIPQGIAALVALWAMGLRCGRRSALAEGLDV